MKGSEHRLVGSSVLKYLLQVAIGFQAIVEVVITDLTGSEWRILTGLHPQLGFHLRADSSRRSWETVQVPSPSDAKTHGSRRYVVGGLFGDIPDPKHSMQLEY